MLFNSFEFLLFYVVVVVAFFAIPHRFRWALLLAASYYFYMSWKPEYVVLLLASTGIDYLVGLGLPRQESPVARRLLLIASLSVNLGMLFTFKYWSFFGENLAALLSSVSIEFSPTAIDVLLPVGISFYTFQSMSYTIDVYRGDTQPTRHFGMFALYVSFFPQLVAGPIERSGRLLPQLWQPKSFDADRAVSGLRIMLWGAFKKVVVADQIGVVVNAVYSSPETYSGPYLALATLFFAVQIYCDFSGYSDIAIGAARVMGYELVINFRRPYFARSMREFWQRWHVSLSTWLRDYVYLPLGGNRRGELRRQFNVLVVFVLGGLWHGAAWTFVVWGFLHGICLILESLTCGLRARVLRWLGWSRTPRLTRVFQHSWVMLVVLVSWVFFRSGSFADAFHILQRAMTIDGFSWATVWSLGLPRFEMTAATICVATVFLIDFWLESWPPMVAALWRRRSLRWVVYLAGLYSIVMLGNFGEVEFIYFQF